MNDAIMDDAMAAGRAATAVALTAFFSMLMPAPAAELKTPETSKYFERHEDPSSHVVSWILKPGLTAHNQQSLYFTAKSMTDDGRFFLYHAACDEFDRKRPHLLVDPKREIRVCDLDPSVVMKKDERGHYATHLTLTADRRRAFLDWCVARRTGFQRREEVVAHELVHAMLVPWGGRPEDEFLAWRTSSSRWRQALGPYFSAPSLFFRRRGTSNCLSR